MDSSHAAQRDMARMSSSPPQRLSAMYQYHNAPEVAPAHGLEYDDTIYPASDKYPIIRESPLYDGKFSGSGRYFGDGSNRPPRIIFGMKIRTFLVVALVMALVVIGAAVGGAVGGKQLRAQHETDLANINATNTALPATATSRTAASAATPTFTAAIPTYTPLNDCPASNNTEYTSQYATSNTLLHTTGLNFTKFCALENPLANTNSTAQNITEAFVYTFSDCIEVCAGYNFIHAGNNCTVAVYQPSGIRPGNCWIGDLGETSQTMTVLEDLDSGIMNVAVLV